MDVLDLFSLDGRVAAVLGGTGVLGGAFCRGLAGAGARVAVLGRSAQRGAAVVDELEQSGRQATFVAVDATDRAQLEAAERAVTERFGGVDILVNAPGVNSTTPFFELDESEWHHILDTNLTSVLLACQVFSRRMVDRGRGGCIINISSASSEIPLSRVPAYSVSKAGLNNLTRYLARELAPQRVRVNALVPGSINTKNMDEATLHERGLVMPLGRVGEASEMAGPAVFLASDASSYVTGQVLVADGGLSLYSPIDPMETYEQ
jgi:NAD(P)-dependent dehydrogenase (short-subunit alcohol dehydrogenase family)